MNEWLGLQGTNPIFFVQILFSIFQLVGVLSPTAKDRWKTYNTRKLLWGSRLSSRSSASAGASDKSLPPEIASSPRPRVQRVTAHIAGCIVDSGTSNQLIFYNSFGVLPSTAVDRRKEHDIDVYRELSWHSESISLPPGSASSPRPRVQRATTHCKMHSRQRTFK